MIFSSIFFDSTSISDDFLQNYKVCSQKFFWDIDRMFLKSGSYGFNLQQSHNTCYDYVSFPEWGVSPHPVVGQMVLILSREKWSKTVCL